MAQSFSQVKTASQICRDYGELRGKILGLRSQHIYEFLISAASIDLSVLFLVLFPFDMCREGCTAEFFKCHQVRVTYTPELSWQEGVGMEQIDQQEWAHLHRLDRKVSKHSHLEIPSLVTRLTTVQPTALHPRQSQIKRAARPWW